MKSCRIVLAPAPVTSLGTPRPGRLALILHLAGCLAFGLLFSSARAQPKPAEIIRLTLPPQGRAGFTPLPPATLGISFTNYLREDRSITNRNLLSGSGVACGDVDGNGWPDLYFCSLDGDNALFLNQGGWKFLPFTREAGVACAGDDSTGAAFADLDGDGDLDLLVNSFVGGTRLFWNDGKARFTEGTDAAGLRTATGATSLAIADVDGDGDLDVYVANFRPNTILDEPSSRFQYRMDGDRAVVTSVNGRPTTEPDLVDRFEVSASGSILENGQPDILWINDGKRRFTAASWTDGTFLDEDGSPLTAPPRDWGLACRFADFDTDGRADLYVCNDLHTPDRFWRNLSSNGQPKFRAVSTRALRSNSSFSMGVDFADVNRDHYLDLFTVDMLSRNPAWRQTQVAGATAQNRPPGVFLDRVQVHRNALHLGRGDGTFSEVAYLAGVEASEWSWGPIFLDVDLDGYEDLLISNGQLRDFQDGDGARRIESMHRNKQTLTPEAIRDMIRSFPRLDTPNVAFRNRRDSTFEDASEVWGFNVAGFSQGMALADLDADGDMDVILNNLLAEPLILRNESIAPRLQIQLKGNAPNTAGIGAKILVRSGRFIQSAEVIGAGRYLSCDQPIRTFAAPDGVADEIQVQWPSGAYSSVARPAINCRYVISESQAALSPATGVVVPPPAPEPWFEDRSADLGGFEHADEPFDDFQRQALLPRRLSQLGPGVLWTDLNSDGWDDLVVGTGRGSAPAAFLGDGKGRLKKLDEPWLSRPSSRDLTGLIRFGDLVLFGSSNYEDGLTNGGCLRILDFKRRGGGEAVLSQGVTAGAVAAGDFDQDGDLEIFVGGRVSPGRFPEPSPSLLLKASGGRLATRHRFASLGLVVGACFTDLDGNGFPELVVTREWQSPAIFRAGPDKSPQSWDPVVRIAGTSGSAPRSMRLSQLRGLWSGVTAGDFDGDGRMDLALGNWGRNTRWHASANAPRTLFYGDLTGNGEVEMVEAWRSAPNGPDLPDRDLLSLSRSIPDLTDRFPTFTRFSTASVQSLIGEPVSTLDSLTVTILDSVVLLNQGDSFQLLPLPLEAQRSPVSAVCVADFNGDGIEDLFLSQNCFAVNPMMNRADAGRGLILAGTGGGSFSANERSGIELYGEQRGAAVADYDQDARPDLAVAQNAGALAVYRNRIGRPGLRVRLKGGPGNPAAYGAKISLRVGNQSGPVRELHCGSGYWSSDSSVVVLARPTAPAGPVTLVVKWPGGKVSQTEVPDGKSEIEVSLP